MFQLKKIFALVTFVLFLFGLFFSSCKTSSSVSQSPPSEKGKSSSSSSSGKKEMTEEERMNLEYIFFNANKEKALGNMDKAEELFAQCIRIDGKNDAAMYELANIYVGKKKYNDALFFAKSAAELKPANNWYQLLLAGIYQQTGKYTEAIAVYDKLAKDNPERIDYFYNLANAYLFAGKLQSAIDVFNMIEAKIGIEKEIIIQKERLYLKLGKTDKAALEVEKLIAANPSDMGAYSVLVELYQVNGMKDKVLETIERMKKVKPDNPAIYLALAEYYRGNNEKEKSFEQLKLAFFSHDLESEIKLRILSSYLPLAGESPEMLQQALELGKIISQTHPAEAMTHAVYADFLTISKQYTEANAEYKAALNIDNKNEAAWQYFLVNTSELRDFNEMYWGATQALELFPNNPFFYLFKAFAENDRKEYNEAVKTLLTGSKLVVDDSRTLADFYSSLGDNYHELKNHTESDKYYEKALEINPKNPTVLNNYAYYLSLRRQNLEKAESMSKISNEIVPNQASYEDTYAWILYTLGKYDEAKVWLEKAMKNGGDKNGTILEHYGDVLFKLNDVTQAVEFWQKAKTAGDASDLIDRKIAERKLYE